MEVLQFKLICSQMKKDLHIKFIIVIFDEQISFNLVASLEFVSLLLRLAFNFEVIVEIKLFFIF